MAAPALAAEYETIFEPDSRCVAYRIVKDMLFNQDVTIVGLSCEVSATFVAADEEGD